MVEVLDPQEGETICDPTCGSGGFLIKAFEYVRDKIEKDVEQYKKDLKACQKKNNLKLMKNIVIILKN